MCEHAAMHASGIATNHTKPSVPVELHWERWGSAADGNGVPLLLVNGLGSPSVSYEEGFLERLIAEGFDVVRFDNRDVGQSTRCPGSRPTESPYRLADMANDVVTVMDAAGWVDAHLFGQSMGGMIVQQVAIDHPGRVRSMTSLMSSTGKRGFGAPTKEAMAALMTPGPTEREAWLDNRVVTERIWASPEHWDPDWVRAKGEAMWERGIDPVGVGRQYKAIQASGDRDEALAALEVATLVMHGSADTLITPDGGQHTAEVIPGARYVEIEGMGHDLAPPLWDRLATEVGGFVREVEQRQSRN